MGIRSADNDMSLLDQTLSESKGIGGRRARGSKKKARGAASARAGAIAASRDFAAASGSAASTTGPNAPSTPETAKKRGVSPLGPVVPETGPLVAAAAEGTSAETMDAGRVGLDSSMEGECVRGGEVGGSAASPLSDPAAESSPFVDGFTFLLQFGHVALDKAIREASRGAVDRSARIAAATAMAVVWKDFFPSSAVAIAAAGTVTTASASSSVTTESSSSSSVEQSCGPAEGSGGASSESARSTGGGVGGGKPSSDDGNDETTARDAARLMASHLAYGLASASCREMLRAGLEMHLRGMRTMFAAEQRGGNGKVDDSGSSPRCVGRLGPQCPQSTCDRLDLNGANKGHRGGDGESEEKAASDTRASNSETKSSSSSSPEEEIDSGNCDNDDAEHYVNLLLDQGCVVIGSAAADEAARSVDASFRAGGIHQYTDQDRRRRMESIDESSIGDTIASGAIAVHETATACGGGNNIKPSGTGRASSIWSVTIGCSPGIEEGDEGEQHWGSSQSSCTPESDASVDGSSSSSTAAAGTTDRNTGGEAESSCSSSSSSTVTFSHHWGGNFRGPGKKGTPCTGGEVTREHLRVYEEFAKLPVRPLSVLPTRSPEVSSEDSNEHAGGPDNGEDDPSRALPSDVEAMADSYFDEIFASERGPHVVVQSLRRFLRSSSEDESPVERDVAASLLCRLLEEYRYLHRYPDHELLIAATTFGMVIREGVVRGAALGYFLRCVLHALSSGRGGGEDNGGGGERMVLFGVVALEQFSNRLDEWPRIRAYVDRLELTGGLVKGISALANNSFTSTVKSA